MSKFTPEQLDTIIKREMPGARLAKTSALSGNARDADARPSRAVRRTTDLATPSIEHLRSKYLNTEDAVRQAPANEGDEAEIVATELDVDDDEADDARGRRRTKAVVISPEGRILGAQG